MNPTASSRSTSTPAVGQVEEHVGHLGEDPRVGPVEVPLEGVEAGPDPLAGLGEIAEVAGGEVGEDLGQGPLVGVGQLPVLERPEHRLGLGIAGPGGHRPGVLGRAVVEDQVDADADPPAPGQPAQPLQVVHGPEPGVDGPVVAHRVAAVRVALPGSQQRHQVQVAHAQLAQVVEVLPDPLEGAGEPVGVADVPDRPRVLEPVRLDAALQVEQLQLLGPLPVPLGQQHRDPLQQLPQVVALPVRPLEPLGQVVPPPPQPHHEQVDVPPRQPLQHLPGPRLDPLRHPAHRTSSSPEWSVADPAALA